MRFLNLGFRAFGPFTGLELDFSGGAPGGFQLIFGANEAGKSSALRGVHDLLFGFPERTSDDHVHPSRELRIAASLIDEAGKVLRLQRLKKRKDSLRDEHDAPLDEHALSTLLGGIDAPIFERVFGLDHERLRQAGEALLKDQGDVGESLFDAGSGGRGIRQVLEDLTRNADQIFKARSSKASLNVLLEGYKEAKMAVRDAQVLPEKWLSQTHKLQAERARLEALVERRKKLREESTAQARLQLALGPIAQRNALSEKLAALGAVPALAENARERREHSQQSLDRATHERSRIERDSAKKRERLAELVVPENLLGVGSEAVAQLRDRVGAFRQAEKDLPRRREDVRRSEAMVARLVATLYPGRDLSELEALRPGPAELSRVRRLPEQQAALIERLANAKKAIRALELRSEQTESALSELPVVLDLASKRRALTAARAKGDLELAVRVARAEHSRLAALSESKLSALGRLRGPLEAVPGLPVPQEETIERFLGEFAELAKSAGELERDRALVQQRLQQSSQKIQVLEGAGSIPSEAFLARSRARRDDGLRRLLGAWERGESAAIVDREYAPDQMLSHGFEQAVLAADEQADRLRREAERVSSLAQLQAERDQLTREEAALGEAQAELRVRSRERHSGWTGIWTRTGIEPDSPLEMRAWLARQRELSELALRVADASRSLSAACLECSALSAELARILGEPDNTPLSELVARCGEAIEAGTLATQRRLELSEQLKDIERQKSEREHELAVELENLEKWQLAWRAATARLGFDRELSADEASTLMDSVAALFVGLDELSEHRRRTRRMEQDRADFAAHVAEWLKTYAPDLIDRAADVAAEALVRRVQVAEHHRAESQELQSELDEMTTSMSALEARVEEAEAELESLRSAAQAPDLASLASIEERVLEARALTRQLAAVEGSLLLEGLPLEQLIQAARGVSSASLQVRVRELEEELERLDEEILDLSAEVRDLEHGLLRYAESEAADHAQALSEQAAEIREQAQRWARFRLSRVVLEREVERYREQNQGPVLKRANVLFPRLTLGRFRGLRVGVEERKIVALREDGKEVLVEGLSEGTRYQLYLALRIASLERYLERNSPLPLVLDDILIHFDDDRAAAALGVLGELSARIQILFFTHHARDLTLAERAIPAPLLFRHELSARVRQP